MTIWQYAILSCKIPAGEPGHRGLERLQGNIIDRLPTYEKTDDHETLNGSGEDDRRSHSKISQAGRLAPDRPTRKRAAAQSQGVTLSNEELDVFAMQWLKERGLR